MTEKAGGFWFVGWFFNLLFPVGKFCSTTTVWRETKKGRNCSNPAL